MQILEELKNLLAHQNYEGRMDVLMKKIAGLALEKLKPKTTKSSNAKCTESQAQSTPSAQVRAPSHSHAQAQIQTQLQTQDQTRRSSSPAPGKARSRYIPASVRRKVMLRDQNGCTYRDSKTGRVCQSKHGLQFDHLVPFCRGGTHTAENLTLRCGSHNRYLVERMGLRH
jgi:5-methylcytosine-specific restriction endonuclease McrA